MNKQSEYESVRRLIAEQNTVRQGMEDALAAIMAEGDLATIVPGYDTVAQALATVYVVNNTDSINYDSTPYDISDVNLEISLNEEEIVQGACLAVKNRQPFTAEARDILATFACVGIESEFSVTAKHCPSIYIVDHINEVPPLVYKNKFVKEILFPKIGCDVMTQHVLRSSVVWSKIGCRGTTIPERYIIGAREKLDGDSAMIFSVTTFDDSCYYFLWSSLCIRPVDATLILYLERVDNKFYSLAYDGAEYIFPDLHVHSHPFHYFTTDILNKGSDGVVVLVDGNEYKIPRERTFSLKAVLEGNSYVFEDKGKKRYDVIHQQNEMSSIIDVVQRGSKYHFHRLRYDRKLPDSTQSILNVLNHMVIVDDVTRIILMDRNDKGHIPNVIEIRECAVADRISMMNTSYQQGLNALYYTIKDSGSAPTMLTFLKKRISAVHLNSMATPNCIGTRRFKSYSGFPPVIYRNDIAMVSNIWFPGAIRVVIRTRNIKMSSYLANIEGFGLGVVFYFAHRLRDNIHLSKADILRATSVSSSIITDSVPSLSGKERDKAFSLASSGNVPSVLIRGNIPFSITEKEIPFVVGSNAGNNVVVACAIEDMGKKKDKRKEN